MNTSLFTEERVLVVDLINPDTKKAKEMIKRWECSKWGDDIHKAYKRPSEKKISTFNNIKKEVYEFSGYSLRITGAGSDIYSCAYKFIDLQGDTYLIYHTPSSRYAILINKKES